MNKACFMVLYGPLETDARVLRSIGVFNAIKKPVTIFTCNTRPGYEAGDNVEIVNVALKVGMLGYLYFCLRIFLYFLFNLRKFDLVYLQDFYSTVPGLLFHPFCRKKRIIYDAHELILPKDGEELSFRDKVFVKAEKKLCKKVFYTIEANQEREDIFKERYNLENVSHVLNISKLSFSAIKRELHEDNITLVYQGVVAKERRLSFFVQCLAKLPDRYKMMIIGDGDALNELKELAETLNVSSRITFTGRLSNDEMLKKLEQCHIGIIAYPMTSLNNIYCSPNKIFEYSAQALPFLATEQPFFKNVQERYGIGRVYHNDDIASFTQETEELVANYDKCCEGFQAFLAEYSYDKEMERLASIITKAIAASA